MKDSKHSAELVRKLEKKIGVSFADKSLPLQAVTHKSFSAENYERLEFLGDGLLNGMIGACLFESEPPKDEGAMTRLRASLVREETLAEIAMELKLGDFLRMGSGELKSGSYRRESVLSDCLEALIGATFVDQGYVAAHEFVMNIYSGRLDNLPDAQSLKDAKTQLQEVLQADNYDLPEYNVIDESGPAHKRHFRVSCTQIQLNVATEASGRSRRIAEQSAARKMLRKLEETK